MSTTPPVPEIVFGNKDFWPEVAAKYPEFFHRIGTLQQAVRNIVDPAYADLDGYQRLQMNLLILIATGMWEVVTLVGNGMGHGAMKIVRGVVENAINAEYLRRFPDQADKYMEWHWVELHKLYVYMQETSPESLNGFPSEKMASDEAEYQRVKGLFRYKVTTPDGSERTVKQDNWCRDNLFQRAEKVDMVPTYRTVMMPGNQILHGSVGGWIREMDVGGHRVEFPPTHRWGAEALIAAHLALLQAVETVALSLNVTPEPSIDSLKEDFGAIWTIPQEQPAFPAEPVA